ncbi:MAG: PAS domain S-box protein [Ignavibacteriaceae bacterium]|jgi:PAS domain S-box-containing protein|nr:PAS domain S-box protein [Ignavibacteriaceae bacterium]
MAKNDLNSAFELKDSEELILILDRKGALIAQNKNARELLGLSVLSSFFSSKEFRGNLNLDKIEASFFASLETDSEIKIETKIGDGIYEFSFNQMKSENNAYISVRIKRAESTVTKEFDVKKIIIPQNEINSFNNHPALKKIIDRIKSVYPFSFIERKKIEKETNQLSSIFIIRDNEGKLLIANNYFWDLLNDDSKRYKDHENLALPEILLETFNYCEKIINNSKSIVVIDSLAIPSLKEKGYNQLLISFPILDIENNVLAYIYSSIGKNEIENQDKSKSTEYIRNLAFPIVLIDEDDSVINTSIEFDRLFELNLNRKIVGQSIFDVFSAPLLNAISEYKKIANYNSERILEYNFSGRNKYLLEVKIVGILDFDNKPDGIQILFSKKDSEIQKLEKKAKYSDYLIKNNPEPIFVYDLENLKFREVSDAALKLYGYNRNEFLNLDLTDLYSPEDIQTLLSEKDKKPDSTKFRGPWRQKRKDNSTVFVEMSSSEIEFNGTKTHLNIIRDITETIESGKKNTIYKALYENCNELLLVTDNDGFIVTANELVTKKLGYSKKDLEKRPFLSIVGDSERARVNKDIFYANITRTTQVDISLKKSSGDLVQSKIIVTPIFDYKNDVESFSIIIRLDGISSNNDISEDSSSKKIDAPFLSNVFHEILTPINVIIGFVQEINESLENPTEEQKEAIDIIKQNQKLLLHIMDNAVEYSRIIQKNTKIKPEEISFSEIFNEVENQNIKTIKSKGISIKYNSFPETIKLETDKSKLISFLSLLLDFTVQISRESSIYFSVNDFDKNYCSIGLMDTKSGITELLLKAIKEILLDDENSIRKNYGLSRFSVKLFTQLIEVLSIKTEILEKNSAPNEILFLFPIKFKETTRTDISKGTNTSLPETYSSSVKQHEISQSVKAEKKEEASEIKNIDLTKLSCLYLEDQVDSQILFKVQLKDLKSVEFADSFEAALPLLKTKKFDFIMMDINLKGEYNGLDALRIIQKMPGYSNTPIIASTAYLLPGDKENFIAAGFRDFIPKPLMREKILTILRKIFV